MAYLEQVLEQAGAIGGGVDEVLEPVRVYRRRADELNTKLAAARAGGERLAGGLVGELAEGRLTDFAELAGRQAEASAWVHDSPASRRVVEAVAAAHRLADAAAVATAPQLFEALQEMCSRVVQESVRLTAQMPGAVVDAESALLAADGVGAAWRRLTVLAAGWVRVHQLAETLRTAGWIPGPPHRHKSALRPGVWTRFRHPELLHRGWAEQPEPLLLGMAAAAGTEPGLWGWDFAEQQLAVHDRQMGRMPAGGGSVVTTFASRKEAALQMPVLEATAQANIASLPAPAVS